MTDALRKCIDLTGMPRAKVEKLLHYCDRDPKKFIQCDAWVNVEHGDDIVTPDEDGDWLCSGSTIELMTGATSVRVLIALDTQKDAVLRALRKIIDWIERRPDIMKLENDMVGNADLTVIDDDPFSLDKRAGDPNEDIPF